MKLIPSDVQVSPAKSTVTVSLDTRGDMVEFSVEDEGPGVPVAMREMIFQPWVKLNGDANSAGLGLGLTICRTAMEELNGSVRCCGRTKGKQGARVVMMMPRAEDSDIITLKEFTLKSSLSVGAIIPSALMEMPLSSPRNDDESDSDLGDDSKRSDYGDSKNDDVGSDGQTTAGNQPRGSKDENDDSDDVEKIERGHDRLMQRVSFPLGVGSGVKFVIARTKSVLAAIRQRLIAEAQAKQTAIRHGHELVPSTAVVLCLLCFLWCAFFLLVPENGQMSAGLCLYLVFGYFCSSRASTDVKGGLGICFTYFTGCTLLQVLSGMCEGPMRVITLVAPMLASLLLKDTRITILVWFSSSVTVAVVDLFFDDCGQDADHRSYWYYLSLDCTYHIMILFFSFSHLFQYRVHNALRDQFIKSMSQELRTPLFAVVCAAEVLKERSTLSSDDIENVQTIIGCGRLLASLLNQSLDADQLHCADASRDETPRSFSPDAVSAV